ncbi:MAG TPA: glycosyltransferase family 39 protein [Bacteroidales bacterium]|nr:glycosyltransferase family 39 protein [Bacteroidales bacterium]
MTEVKRDNIILLLLILTAGFLLRIWGISQMPFQHDEFSAIFRLSYDDLGSLMREGVALRDSHPAGVQLFLYYWTQLTGLSHLWMRLPFIILGTISIYLIYRIGQRLFGEAAGLPAAAAMAVMQYFVYYSQMARPYIPGVFFNLWAFSLLLDIRQSNNPRFSFKHVLLALALAMAAWVHHFSALQAGLIYLAGFIIMPKNLRRPMFVVALVALILYIPQSAITLTQMRAGGIGGWLGKPDAGFLPGFVAYTANYSLLFGAAMLFLLFFQGRKVACLSANATMRIVLIFLFLIPFFMGWLYSVLRIPVLQFSTLIFGFPFLMIAFFSFGIKAPGNVVVFGVLLILFTGAGSLLYGRKHIKVMQQQAFSEAPKIARAHANQFGSSYTFVTISSNPAMFSFYMPGDEAKWRRSFNMREPLADFSQMLDTLQTEYLGLAWADYVPFDWIATARGTFGEVVERYTWFNAEYYLLRRSDAPKLFADKERWLMQQDFNPGAEVAGEEYALLFESDSLFVDNDDAVAISVHGKAVSMMSGLRLVLEFRQHPDSLPSVWLAGQLARQVQPDENFTLHVAWRFDSGDARLRHAILRTYLWNPEKEHFVVLGRNAWAAGYDKALFGLFKPL